jgi:eukaryotic-like serine/threonine-protein kinase
MGPYRLLRKIGHGDMSTVWLAESAATPVKREVAQKLLHGSGMQPRRFERERDLLAALTHAAG